jgi:hypothetical protein
MEIKKGKSPFEGPVSELRLSEGEEVAARTGAAWEQEGEGGRLVLPVLNETVTVTYPSIELEAPEGLNSYPLKLLSLLYLCKADGTPPSGRWAAYREVTDGRFYEPVVERSVVRPIQEAFNADLDAFSQAGSALGGEEVDMADMAFSFRLFPLVVIGFALWAPDEEFPGRAQVLFDSNCERHLDAFNLRMGAQEISGRLIRLAGRQG